MTDSRAMHGMSARPHQADFHVQWMQCASCCDPALDYTHWFCPSCSRTRAEHRIDDGLVDEADNFAELGQIDSGLLAAAAEMLGREPDLVDPRTCVVRRVAAAMTWLACQGGLLVRPVGPRGAV